MLLLVVRWREEQGGQLQWKNQSIRLFELTPELLPLHFLPRFFGQSKFYQWMQYIQRSVVPNLSP